MCVIMVISLMPAMAFGATEPETVSTAEAKIGDVEYATLEEAFANVQDDEYIILQKDVTVDEIIPVTANYVGLDLNGHKLTATTEDKIAFKVSDFCYRFGVYDGTALWGAEFGAKKDCFDAKIYIDCDSSASIAPILYDGTQIVYDDNFELVISEDLFYAEYLGNAADAYRFNVSTEDIVTYYYATKKLDGIYFAYDYEGQYDELIALLGLKGEAETVGNLIEILTLEPDGESVKADSWGIYCIPVGSTLLDTLDFEYNYVMETCPDEIQYYFHESFYPGYRIAGWQEVEQYDVDYETEKVKDLVLGDAVTEFNGDFITICPIWEKVESPAVDPSTPAEKLVVVTDEKAQEKSIKAVNKLIEDIAAGKDTDKKISNDIKQIVNKALAAGVETFDIYTEAKVEYLEKGDVAAADVTLIEKQAGEGTVAQYLDLSVIVSVLARGENVSYQAKGNLYELDEAITFNIAIPKDLQNVPEGMQREYYVIRVHDGVAEVLETTDLGNNVLSFQSDSFSTYALAYKDTVKPAEAPAAPAGPAVPNTGNADGMLPWMALIALMGAGAVYFKKREN